MAGDAGFEPAMPGPEPGALPLGQSPILNFSIITYRGVRKGFTPISRRVGMPYLRRLADSQS